MHKRRVPTAGTSFHPRSKHQRRGYQLVVIGMGFLLTAVLFVMIVVMRLDRSHQLSQLDDAHHPPKRQGKLNTASVLDIDDNWTPTISDIQDAWNIVPNFPETPADFENQDVSAQLSTIQYRLAARDTGRTRNIPVTHFSLHQPAPHAGFHAYPAAKAALLNTPYFQSIAGLKDARYAPALVPQLAHIPRKSWTPQTESLARDSFRALLTAWSLFASERDVAWWLTAAALHPWVHDAPLQPHAARMVHVSVRQLLQLVSYNRTRVQERFLFDVNPGYMHRGASKENAVDVRLVDTQTGFMLDVLALTYVGQGEDGEEDVACKTPEVFAYEDLIPLHETWLDGIRVWRPHAALRMVAQELGEDALLPPEQTQRRQLHVFAQPHTSKRLRM